MSARTVIVGVKEILPPTHCDEYWLLMERRRLQVYALAENLITVKTARAQWAVWYPEGRDELIVQSHKQKTRPK